MTVAIRTLWILLEGGGSRSWAGFATDNAVLSTATSTSTNPRSVGTDQAARTLTALLTEVLTGHDLAKVGGVVAAHGAASTTSTAARFAAMLRDVLAQIGASELPVWITNDIAPLLLRNQNGPVCAVIAGTGTGFAARHQARCARASGLDWLLTDEGGGHDLARAGLRAAIRALDHRGSHTTLTAAAATWCQKPAGRPLLDALFDAVYTNEDASKVHIATFAPHVLATASQSDPVAVNLVEAAANELATGALAVCRATGITVDTPLTLVVSGSLLTRSTTLRPRLIRRLTRHLRLTRVTEHREDDHPAALLALCRTWQSDPNTVAALAEGIPTWPSPSEHPASTNSPGISR